MITITDLTLFIGLRPNHYKQYLKNLLWTIEIPIDVNKPYQRHAYPSNIEASTKIGMLWILLINTLMKSIFWAINVKKNLFCLL